MAQKKEKIKILRADFVNADTPNYIGDITFKKVEGNEMYSRRFVDLEGKTEREKLSIIFSLLDNFNQVVIFEMKEEVTT